MASVASKSVLLSAPPSLCPRPCNNPQSTSPSNLSLQFQVKRGRATAGNSQRCQALAPSSAVNSAMNGVYKVGDFMTRKKNLHVVTPTTPVDQALEALVEKKITGFPVIDDEWNLVGVVSDYDLLALDSISGPSNQDAGLFPDVDSSWKAFYRIQKLLTKTHGKVVGDLMTPNPLVVRENTNLDDAARLLLKTKYHRLPVVDGGGRLIGIITRGDIVRAALKMKQVEQSSN